MTSLYQLTEDYKAAALKLEDLDLPEQVISDTLEGMTGEIEAKAQNIAAFVRNLESTAEAIAAAEKQMEARRKAIERRAAHVRSYLLHNMIGAGISKIECPWFKLSVCKNPESVEILSEADIPGQYMRYPELPPPVPDKKAIREALASGVEVAGARLIRTQRLDIK